MRTGANNTRLAAKKQKAQKTDRRAGYKDSRLIIEGLAFFTSA